MVRLICGGSIIKQTVLNQVRNQEVACKTGRLRYTCNEIVIGIVMTREFDVLIEISPAQGPVKYEFCKESNRLRVDRFLQTSMAYPCNYGYIPNTMSDDGDPCDVMVVCEHDILPGSLITVRAVGMLVMEDEAGLDNKILAVPVDGISPSAARIQNIKDVDQNLLSRIEHFFQHYKDLESKKWVKVQGWEDKAAAEAEVEKGQA